MISDDRRALLRRVREAVAETLADGPLPFTSLRALVELAVPECGYEDVRWSVGYLRKLGRIEPAGGAWRLMPENEA